MSRLLHEVLTDPAHVSELRDVWNRNADAAGLNLYASYEWVTSLWESHLAFRDTRFHALRSGGDLRSVVPLTRGETQKLGITLSILGLLTNRYGRNHNDLIIFGDKPETFLSLLDALQPEAWDILFLGSIHSEETRGIVESLQSRGRYRLIPERYVESPYLSLGGDWSSVLAGRSANFRSDLKRKQKRATQAGATFRVLKEPSDVPQALAAMYAIETHSWKESSGTSITTQAHSRNFYDVFLPKAAERGWLHCVLLELEGTPAAFDMGVLHGGKYYMLKTSYDQAWQDVSPGFVLRAHVIEQLCMMGVTEHDFLGDPEPWKLRWTDEIRKHWNLYLYNTRRPAANLYSAAVRLLRSREGEAPGSTAESRS